MARADPLGVHFRQRTCCPSFLLSIAGPWICLQGGILVGKTWVMQPLTESLCTGNTEIRMNAQVRQIARLFCSLRVALKALEARFLTVKDTPQPSIPPIFPFITSFIDRNTQIEQTLAYRDRLHFQEGRSGTAIFSASLENGEPVFVKFAARYNALAHEILAGAGLAPRLRYCSKLADDETHFMVVMDRITGQDMHGKRFQEEDLARVQRATKLLHENNYVFGDPRPNNIIKPTDGTGVVLVDFDWCGRDGSDTYPVLINMEACEWHRDVEPGGVMRKTHDDHLFERLRLLIL